MDKPFYNEKTLKEKYKIRDEWNKDETLDQIKSYFNKNYKPSKKCMQIFLHSKLPIVNWMRKIDFKNDILKDIVAGLTVGIILIAPSKPSLIKKIFFKL